MTRRLWGCLWLLPFGALKKPSRARQASAWTASRATAAIVIFRLCTTLCSVVIHHIFIMFAHGPSTAHDFRFYHMPKRQYSCQHCSIELSVVIVAGNTYQYFNLCLWYTALSYTVFCYAMRCYTFTVPYYSGTVRLLCCTVLYYTIL